MKESVDKVDIVKSCVGEELWQNPVERKDCAECEPLNANYSNEEPFPDSDDEMDDDVMSCKCSGLEFNDDPSNGNVSGGW